MSELERELYEALTHRRFLEGDPIDEDIYEDPTLGELEERLDNVHDEFFEEGTEDEWCHDPWGMMLGPEPPRKPTVIDAAKSVLARNPNLFVEKRKR